MPDLSTYVRPATNSPPSPRRQSPIQLSLTSFQCKAAGQRDVAVQRPETSPVFPPDFAAASRGFAFAQVRGLRQDAKALDWSTGIRCHTGSIAKGPGQRFRWSGPSFVLWRVQGSNLRRLSRLIYSQSSRVKSWVGGGTTGMMRSRAASWPRSVLHPLKTP